MHLSFKSICNKEHKWVICNMTSSSNSSQSTRPTGRVLGKNCSSFLDFTRNYERTSGIFVPCTSHLLQLPYGTGIAFRFVAILYPNIVHNSRDFYWAWEFPIYCWGLSKASSVCKELYSISHWSDSIHFWNFHWGSLTTTYFLQRWLVHVKSYRNCWLIKKFISDNTFPWATQGLLIY